MSRRLILIEDNSCVCNGHYNELASVILHAAARQGWKPVYVAHQQTALSLDVPVNCKVLRVHHTRRLIRWSCSLEGRSQFARDLNTQPLQKSFARRLRTWKEQHLVRRQFRPSNMLNSWVQASAAALRSLALGPEDQIILQTADDFTLLALAAALKEIAAPPCQLHAIFHFPIYEHGDQGLVKRVQFDEQMNYVLDAIKPHRLQLYATTDQLAEQLNSGTIRQAFHAVDYPVRSFSISPNLQRPPRLVLGGIQRAEQGRNSCAALLEQLWPRFIKTGRLSLTLQLPQKDWQALVPKSLRSEFAQWIAVQDNDSPVDIRSSQLTPADFQQMVSDADLMLFLYNPQRYYARCSSVLLEAMAMGVPTIVPDGCWLSTESVRFNDAGVTGFIYRHHHELPQILARALDELEVLKANSVVAARAVAETHSADRFIRTVTGWNQQRAVA